jgi:nuclease-like protein
MNGGAGHGTASPVNEGLGIFGGVATTEATDDAPGRDAGRPAGRRAQRAAPPPAAAEAPPATAPGSPQATAVGAAWNQTITSPPVPSGAAEESKPTPLGRVLGRIRGGGPADGGGGPGGPGGPGGAGGAGGPGNEPPRVGVRDLPPDVQIEFWRKRAILMVVVGAAAAALTRSWEIAVTLAILAGIADTVRRARNPNLHLYLNGAKHPGAHKQTRAQLNKMRREGYFTLDARAIPGSQEVIDHLVVGPTGVYAIDSERWDPRLPIRTINGRRLYLGPESQKDRLEHAVWEASQASEILSAALGYEVSVRPALAIYGPRVPWDVATIRNVDVFTGTALGKYLKQRHWKRTQPNEGVPSLTREQVRTIYDTAERMLPEASPSRTTTPVG